MPISIPNAEQMVTLYYVELFTLHGVGFRFQLQLPTTGMASELGSGSESRSAIVNKPLPIEIYFL